MRLTLTGKYTSAIKRPKSVAGAIVALCVSLLGGQCCFAGDAKSNVPVFPEHLWSKNARSTDLDLIPPSQMSDEQLLLTAEAVRNCAGKINNRLLNNLWLTMEQSKQFEGAKAVGEILSLGILSYRRALTRAEVANPFDTFILPSIDEALITQFRNYEFEVTGSSVALSIKLHID